MVTVVLTVGIVAFVLACAGTGILLVLGRRAGLVDGPGRAGQDKVVRPVPNVGGIAITWTIIAPVAALLAVAWGAPGIIDTIAPVASVHVEGIRERTPMALGLLGALLALHIVGLIDDRRPLGAWPKLLVMLTVSAAVVIGLDVRMFEFLDGIVHGWWASAIISILWLIAVTNALNFMDNMDGAAGGVGAVAAMLFLLAAIEGQQWFVAAMLALLAGALGGFLVFNLPPAKIFMGDGGSLVIGFLLGFLTIRTTYIPPAPSVDDPPASLWYAALMPVVVLAVPLYDLASVILIRLSQGRNPFVGDQQHFTHRLRDRGLSGAQVVAIVTGCTALTGIGGVLLRSLAGWQAVLVGVQTLLVLALLGIYEHASTRARGRS